MYQVFNKSSVIQRHAGQREILSGENIQGKLNG